MLTAGYKGLLSIVKKVNVVVVSQSVSQSVSLSVCLSVGQSVSQSVFQIQDTIGNFRRQLYYTKLRHTPTLTCIL